MKRLTTITVIGVLLVLGSVAHAKRSKTVSYSYDQVFPAAVRFLRIDEGVKIVERDTEAGYIVFELTDDGTTFEGYFEIARVHDTDGRKAARLIVRINDRPEYMEQGLIDRFGIKLRSELGAPVPPPPVKKKQKKKPEPKQGAKETP